MVGLGEGVALVVAVGAHVAAALVAVAGAAKILRPAVTSKALSPSRFPVAPSLVRVLGSGEVALALVVLAVGGRVAFAVLAVSYAGFTLVAVHQRGAGRSCGCFGASDTTVGPLHLVTDGVAGALAVAASVLVAPSLPALLPGGTVAAATSVLLMGVGTALGRMLLTSLPDLLRARQLLATGGGG